MKRLHSIRFVVALTLLLAIFAVAAVALDRGPQRVTATLYDGAGAIVPPTGDTGRFTAECLIFACAAGETQTVSYVVAGVTNVYGTKVVSATDHVLAITSMPTLFSGDRVLVASSATSVTNSATLVGTLFD